VKFFKGLYSEYKEKLWTDESKSQEIFLLHG